MKKLSFEQMETISAGSLRKILSCASQVTSGMGFLGGAAALLAFGTNPVGLVIFGLGFVSLITGAASDPTACD